MAKRSSILTEIWAFVKETKKWWLVPLLLVMALFGLLILFSGSPIAPFIYTLF